MQQSAIQLPPPPEPETDSSEVWEWHQNCVVTTVLLASSFERRAQERLLKKAGNTATLPTERGGELLRALHEACHLSPEVQAAVAKELGSKYGHAVRSCARLDPEDILDQAGESPWPVPLLWACFARPDHPAREAGRILAHGIVAQGMDRLRGQCRLEQEQERVRTLTGQNRALRNEIKQLVKQNHDLAQRRKRTVAPKPAPSQPAAVSSHKKEIKQLRKELASQKQQMEQLRSEAAVWRSLACREEEKAKAAAPEAPGIHRGDFADCGEECPRTGAQRPAGCPLRGRRVAVIGGLDRLERNYCEVIEQMGGSCLCHTGKVRSGARRLRQIVNKSDVVVFLTPINSHAALNVVKKHCKQCATPFCPLNCTSPAALESHLKEMRELRAAAR